MIRFEEVSKVYPDSRRAVYGVSFTVGEGKCVVLVGPSGCGKITTLKLTDPDGSQAPLLANLRRPDVLHVAGDE